MTERVTAATWRGKIRDVLNRVWDPIGGCPPDEYDAYIDALDNLIRTSASDTEFLAYLEWAEIENMGFSGPFDPGRGEKVVKALREPGPAS